MNNLRALVLKRLMQQFSDLRNRITKKHRKELVLKTMVANTISWQKRQVFWIWRRQDEKVLCCEEVNEVGPVVKEVQT